MSLRMYTVCGGMCRSMLEIVHAFTLICLCVRCVYLHLLTCSASSLFSGLSPLHLAVLRGHTHLAKMLLDAGADINAMVSPCAAPTQH